MSRVSYFQRFSQRENHATNNTLLLFRYFYESSPFKLEEVLNALLESELEIGLTFNQQQKGSASVLDAVILQRPLRIFIETKTDSVIDVAQIKRHLKSMAGHQENGKGDILLVISKVAMNGDNRKALVAHAKEQQVAFAAITFLQIVEALRKCCSEFETDLRAIVDDYEEYLIDERLTMERDHKLALFLAGTSLNENIEYELYYEPSSRRRKQNKFIGLYHQKAIVSIGQVLVIAVCTYKQGKPFFETEEGNLGEMQQRRITEAVDGTSYYNLRASPHRFYLVDEFVEVNCQKASPGPLRGFRYVDLADVIPDFSPNRNYSTGELAALLKSKTWY
jgi:hypothetical protein